jgi:hypothetical protein
MENLDQDRQACTQDSHLSRIGEWLDFHLFVLGMDHIYVYDNSREPYTALWQALRPYVAAGRVTYHPWPHRNCMPPGLSYKDWGGEQHVSHFSAENSALRR